MSVHDFRSQKRLQASPEELLRISQLPLVDYRTIPDIDDKDKYDWHQITTMRRVKKGDVKIGYAHGEPKDDIIPNDSKYGRRMYCPKTGIARTQTMGEFYGNATVD